MRPCCVVRRRDLATLPPRCRPYRQPSDLAWPLGSRPNARGTLHLFGSPSSSSLSEIGFEEAGPVGVHGLFLS